MSRAKVLAFCTAFPGAFEDYPFGEQVAVFKVGGRMFALVGMDGDPVRMTLKCDPDLAIELRARHAAVVPGYHSHKRHWNTITLDGTIAADELEEMIEHSYDIVVDKLPKSLRARLAES